MPTSASTPKAGDLVAVLHARRDLADQALGMIKAQYDHPREGENDKSIFDHLLKAAPQGQVLRESGSLTEEERLAAAIVEETYLNSYVARSGLTHQGKISFWDCHIDCAGDSEARQFYTIPHQRTVSSGGGGEILRGYIPSASVRGVRPRSTRTSSRANRRLTSWRRRRATILWSSV
jgi:hypothetical protein